MGGINWLEVPHVILEARQTRGIAFATAFVQLETIVGLGYPESMNTSLLRSIFDVISEISCP